MPCDECLRHVGHSVAVECGVDHLVGPVQYQPAFDPDPDLATVSLKLPSVQATCVFLSVIDAVVVDEVLRRFWNAPSGKILWRRDRDQTPLGADPHGDHVFVEAFSQAYAGIEFLFDNVPETVVAI